MHAQFSTMHSVTSLQGMQRTGMWPKHVAVCAAACALLATPMVASGQGSLAVGSASAPPGQASVAIPITATTSTKITGLRAEIQLPSALCGQISNQRVRETGRTTVPDPRVLDPQEGGRCPAEPLVSIVLIDLVLRESTGEAVIPPGSGPIAEWVFDVNTSAAPGEYDLNLRVVEARNGPQTVALATMPGKLTVGAVCPGDCNGDGVVTINDLIVGVNIALNSASLDQCSSFDGNDDGSVTVEELIVAVNNALNDCGRTAGGAAGRPTER